MSNDELVYYLTIGFGLTVKEARNSVAERKEEIEKELALYLALRGTKPPMKPEAIKAIESILSKGDRAELIPGPNGSVKIIQIKRKTIKGEHIAPMP